MTESLAEEVRRRRVALGLSQSDLAAHAGISRDTFGKFECSKRRSYGRTVECILQALERLEGGSDAPVGEEVASRIDALADSYASASARSALRLAARIARGEA